MIVTGTHPSGRKIIIKKDFKCCTWEAYNENNELIQKGQSKQIRTAQRQARSAAIDKLNEDNLYRLGNWTWRYNKYEY